MLQIDLESSYPIRARWDALANSESHLLLFDSRYEMGIAAEAKYVKSDPYIP